MKIMISCTKSKKDYPCRAEEMYSESDLFRKSLNYAKQRFDDSDIYILSAKYGCIPLTKQIEPYNTTLNNYSRVDRERWAKFVSTQMDTYGIPHNEMIYFLCGKNYYSELVKHYPNHKILFENVPLGKRLALLK